MARYPKTLQEFRGTRITCRDLAVQFPEACNVRGQPGLVYIGCVFVLDASRWEPPACGKEPRWFTNLDGQDMAMDDLQAMEVVLWNWAKANNLC